MEKIILCLGDNTAQTDELARFLADDLKIQYNGLLSPDTQPKVGLYQSSLYDISLNDIIRFLPDLSELIVLNISINNELLENHLPEVVFNKIVSSYTATQPEINNNKILKHAVFLHGESTQDTFCVLPWIHLYSAPDGTVLPCCDADVSLPIGSLNQQDISTVRNSPAMIKIRKNMLNGIAPIECNRCFRREQQNKNSPRITSNNRFIDVAEQLREKKDITASDLISIDIRPSNVCNMKCRTCTPEFSSKWYPDFKILFNESYSGITSHKINYDEIDFAKIKRVYFAGGEPLLMEEHYDILDRLIAANNLDVSLFYNSNASSLTFNNKNVLDYWKKFNNVEISASIDAVGEQAAYIRHGTSWDTIVNNLRTIKNLNSARIGMTFTVSLLNVLDIINTYEQLKNLDLFDLDLINFNIVNSTIYDLGNLPGSIRQKLIADLKVYTATLDNKNVANNFNKLIAVLNSSNLNTKERLKDFFRITDQLDQIRGENLADVLPKVNDLRNFLS